MKPIETMVVLITGATDGLGRALAHDLARNGATLLIHGRDEEKGAETIREIRDHRPEAEVAFVRADFGRLSEVREMADVVRSKVDRLDLLINNAGVYPDRRIETDDGFELAFQVNYLAHALLTRRLLPFLEESAPARIVNVASAGQRAIDFSDPMLKNSFDSATAYCQSKLAQIIFTFDLAEEIRGRRVLVNALHPGTYMPTKMVIGRFPPTNTIAEGVASVRRLATDRETDEVTGRYYFMEKEARAESQAYDPAARRKLRELTDGIIGRYLA